MSFSKYFCSAETILPFKLWWWWLLASTPPSDHMNIEETKSSWACCEAFLWQAIRHLYRYGCVERAPASPSQLSHNAHIRTIPLSGKWRRHRKAAKRDLCWVSPPMADDYNVEHLCKSLIGTAIEQYDYYIYWYLSRWCEVPHGPSMSAMQICMRFGKEHFTNNCSPYNAILFRHAFDIADFAILIFPILF